MRLKIYLFPAFATIYFTYIFASSFKQFSNIFMTHDLIVGKVSNLSNFMFGEIMIPVGGFLILSILFYLIFHVGILSTKKKMFWINTFGIIAPMKNAKIFVERAMMKGVTKTMSIFKWIIFSAKIPVTMMVAKCGPFPTTIWSIFINFFPKSFFKCFVFHAILLGCFTANGQSYFKGPALIEGFSEIATAAGTSTLTKDSETNVFFTGTSTQTLVLPDATTLPLGRYFVVQNKSTGAITVNMNGGSLLTTIEPDTQIKVTVTSIVTPAGVWNISTSGGLTGILGVDKGGTGLDATNAANGSLLIGNGTDFSLATITGTANQVDVTNGAGTITLSTPQDIATTSSPTFDSAELTGDLLLSNADFDGILAGDSFAMTLSTGLRSGGVMSVNVGDNTKADVAAGIGYVLDYSTPATPTIKRVAFGPFSAVTITNLASADFTWVLVNSSGSLVQQTTPPTPTEHRQNIVLGRLNHSNRTNLSFANTLPDVEFSPVSQFGDLADSLGPFNISGNIITANGANLSMNKSAGKIFHKGYNYSSSTTNPHVVTTGGLTAFSFVYQNQTGGPGSYVTVLDPTKYDAGGVTTTVPGLSNATVQRVYLFASNTFRVQRGQAVYSSFTNALQNYAQETFNESPLISGFAVPVAFIVITKNCTSLQNTSCAKIIPASKFGGPTGGGSGGSTTLQQAYNNSVQPQITIDSTQLGIQFRDASTPIGSSLFAVKNNAGSTNYLGVDVNGISTTNFVGSGTTGAVRVHNLTTTQKNALTPAAGMIVYDTTLARFECYTTSWAACGSADIQSSDLTLTASDTIAISLVSDRQTWLVQGGAAAIDMSTTPFGSSAPINGAEITLIGNNDTFVVFFPSNDAAKGIIGNSFTLGRGQVVTVKYNATLDRYVIKSTSN